MKPANDESSQARPIEILLVEDSTSDRLLAIETLHEAIPSSVLHFVEDGEEALLFLRRQGRHADAQPPDLVLLDLNLPRMDGHEVLAEIKRDPVLRMIPVIVLTTSRAEADIVAAYGGHANAYLAKPLDLADFAMLAESMARFWVGSACLPPKTALLQPQQPEQQRPPRPKPIAHGLDRVWRVLIIEDSPSDAFLLQQALAESHLVKFEERTVGRLDVAEQALRTERFDVVVCDLGLPDSEGLATVRRVCTVAGSVPVIVLTMLDDEAAGLEFLREGAADYIVKGQLSGRALARAIRYSIDRRGIEEHLRHAQRMESLGVLAGGVAHEFNNLLTVIRGNAQLLGMGEGLSSEHTLGARQIEQSCDRAALLTRQLLTFSRREPIRMEPLDLGGTVSAFSSMLTRLVGPGIQIELHLPQEPVRILGDRALIEHALMNLSINARDAMRGGGRLELTVERGPQGHGPRLIVFDTGEGIPPEILPHIFEPFFTTKETGKGTGLGLSTVFGIMQQHRGHIQVASAKDAGTTFTLQFPDASATDARAPEAPQKPPRGGSETILLVDDEDLVRKVSSTVLRKAGYTVLEARSGAEALAQWPDVGGRVDLLCTDLMMPDGLHGHELAAALLAQKPKLKVVFMSGYASGVPGIDFKLVPGENFVAKPFRIAELTQTVRAALGSPQG